MLNIFAVNHKKKKRKKNGTTEVSCSLTVYGWTFTGNKRHAYLAKTRVEKAEMKYLVCTGDLNFRKLFRINGIFSSQGIQV